MASIDQFRVLVAAFEQATGIKRVTLSWRLFADSKKLKAIMDGGDLQTQRFDKAVQWFSDNWPEAMPWPVTLSRPERQEAA